MPITFDSTPIFGPGPMRTHEGERGSQVLIKARVSAFDPGSQAIGPLEVNVHVRGRLVADSDSSLHAAIDAVHTLLTHPPTAATLADGRSRSWSDMSFTSFTVADRIDRGRETSVSFEARFVRFL